MRIITAALLVFITSSCMAQLSQAEFIENKGQWNGLVRFKAPLTNGAFFLGQNGFTVVRHEAGDLEKIFHSQHGRIAESPLMLRSHAYTVNFLNNSIPAITGEHVQSYSNNYFIGNDPSKWAVNCTVAGAIVYKGIYPGIDIRYYATGKAIKYDIIVTPGADPSQVKLLYDGVEYLFLNDKGELVIGTSVERITENIPVTYSIVNGKRENIQCRYKLTGNIVQFEPGKYSSADTLVIDPQIVFSTFTGSTADNWANRCHQWWRRRSC